MDAPRIFVCLCCGEPTIDEAPAANDNDVCFVCAWVGERDDAARERLLRLLGVEQARS